MANSYQANVVGPQLIVVVLFWINRLTLNCLPSLFIKKILLQVPILLVKLKWFNNQRDSVCNDIINTNVAAHHLSS